MAETSTTIAQVEPEHPIAQRIQKRFPAWHQLALGGITIISIFMNFFQLGQNGFGSYYPAAVRSMMDNWHNFFFAAYDPGGFVTIDKPPVGFWLDVASARLFGFTSFSILLPQALAGVLSVLLLYYLVRRHFGVAAGLLAALALALSPISVVTNRNITIDSTLALTLLVGAWAVLRAAETGRLRWLLLSAAIVGIGFNIKMLEAYLVVPAFGLLYLLAAPRSLWKRIGHLALAGMLLLVISLSWVVAVDLTPASQRPYVGSTQDNSELSLAIGYNGIERLLGSFGRGFGGGLRANTSTNATNRSGNTPGNGGPTNTGGNGARQQPPSGGPGGTGGLFDIGTPGPLRLFTEPLGGQIVWLLPLAILGMIALAWQRRPRLQSDRQQQSLVFWGMWLLTMGIFFSVAGFFHQYYMTEMAPAIAALFGIGLVTMWQDYRRSGWRGWLLPLALIATVAEQIYILTSYPTWGQWMIPLMIVLSILAVGVLTSARIAPRLRVKAPGVRFLLPALGIGVLALMIAPTVWAATPVLQGTQADTLVAGPSQGNGFGGNFAAVGGRNENASSNSALIRYLETHQGTTKFLVAVPSSNTADGIILATNKPVMALGGFSGSDPILTTTQLASLVAKGTVRFFLLNSFSGRGQLPSQILDQIPEQFRNRIQSGPGGFGGGQQSALTSWVTQHCKTVSTSLWQSSSTSTGSSGFGPGRANQLYDCATAP
ncbi:MAG TPA: glycosyl transferase family 39 [Ktedonobacter sp.]|jgi:4-amino-4-deoxy-L-arabinose transferase-like glycosyltransferase|nr:glycosyl transferase family 39 [Ktedonobacter sp.]HAT46275.1 glycosyl transferase family 39 [Ktedonobacter sp.]HBE27265.1 glycosyl transferase family 39 [Ktedonobacter sp.]HCF87268.1 glycosyl transferase family 39 [Ktedonobacter sp.]HCJ35007.1 glycosyl transferase family 39 [Ktedonobacter sp.]